jgi:hypothetical protein
MTRTLDWMLLIVVHARRIYSIVEVICDKVLKVYFLSLKLQKKINTTTIMIILEKMSIFDILTCLKVHGIMFIWKNKWHIGGCFVDMERKSIIRNNFIYE